MSSGLILDLVLVAILGSYALTGYRQGFVQSVLSVLGFLLGGAAGMAFLPGVIARLGLTANATGSRVALVVGVLLLATVGQTLGVVVARSMRKRVRRGPIMAADAVLGATAALAAVAVLAWFVAGGVRGITSASVSKAIGESRVLAVIDRVVPPATGEFFAGFRQMLDRSDFPRVFQGLATEPITPVDPPSVSLGGPALSSAMESVVKIRGVAQACRQGQEGSGWVVAPERVVTNAHVVAGVSDASVQVKGVGRVWPATVVAFDPRRDLAVLAVPGLTAPPLLQGPELGRGADVVIAGFPLDGPLVVGAARVRQRLVAVGADIYGKPGAQRELYSLFGEVEPGNSGGPLFDPEGRVVGVIFAKSIDDEQTGYALTLAEARSVLDAAAGSATPVGTGTCTVG